MRNEIVTELLTTIGFITSCITAWWFVIKAKKPFKENIVTTMLTIGGTVAYGVLFGLEMYGNDMDFMQAWNDTSPWVTIMMGLFVAAILLLSEKNKGAENEDWLLSHGAPISITLGALLLVSSVMELFGVPHE